MSDPIVNDINPALHVVPTADRIEHNLSDDCVCGPRVEPVKREDGSVGWIAVHHSLDGREGQEPQ